MITVQKLLKNISLSYYEKVLMIVVFINYSFQNVPIVADLSNKRYERMFVK